MKPLLVALAVVALGGPLRHPLESNMTAHMLIQLPTVALLGAFLRIPDLLTRVLEKWDRSGLASLLAAVFTAAFWMLPRNLDAAVGDTGMDAAKFVSLMLFVGMALRWSWPRLPSLARGVVWSQLAAMMMVMGWVYLAAPVRVCVNYGMSQQHLAGYGFIAASLTLGVWLTARVFISGVQPRNLPW